MQNLEKLSTIRREYNGDIINEKYLYEDPITQFQVWFAEVIKNEQYDATAMVCATIDANGHPDTRIVLLKGIDCGGFIFYTHYNSTKGIQLEHNPYVALNFYWPSLARQVRIRGKIKKTTKAQSDEYFYSRPINSQISAIISPQSQKISSRDEIEESFNQSLLSYELTHTIKRPVSWGGYIVIPQEMEFWQGCNNRLHDRIQYIKQINKWIYQRLAP